MLLLIFTGTCNLPPVFTQDMNNVVLSEAVEVGSIVYTLEGYDPEKSEITFGLVGTDNFEVDPKTGAVKVIKALDREVNMVLSIFIFICLYYILDITEINLNVSILIALVKLYDGCHAIYSYPCCREGNNINSQ